MGAVRMKVFVGVLVLWLAACSSGPRQTAEDASRSRDDQARAHSELGLSYFEAGRYQYAIEELNEALKARPEHVPALVGLALVNMELKDDAKAEAYFKRAQRADAGNPMTQNNYGQFLCSRGRTEDGLKLLLSAAANPLYDTPDLAYKNAGLCARRAGDPRRAEEYFRQAVMRNPGQLQALYYLAEMNYARDDAKQAKGYIDRALKDVESPGPEWLWLASRTERRLGNKQAADRHAEHLRKRYPDSPQTRALLEGRYE